MGLHCPSKLYTKTYVHPSCCTNSRTEDGQLAMAATARLVLFCVVLVALLALDECKYISLIIIASIYHFFSLFLLDLFEYCNNIYNTVVFAQCDIDRQPNWWLWQRCCRFGWEQNKSSTLQIGNMSQGYQRRSMLVLCASRRWWLLFRRVRRSWTKMFK